MKKRTLFNKKFTGLFLGATVISMMMFSCNKDFVNTLKNAGSDSTVIGKGERKTLLIIVDGAVGTEVRAAKPRNLSLLADFAIHSYDALADYNTTTGMSNAKGWSNILTGVKADKHQVTGTDFTGNNLAQYPSLIKHLKEKRPDWRTSAFVANKEVIDFLAADATEKNSFAGDDAAVKEAVKSELSSKNSAFVLAQFHKVDVAGTAGSYSVSDPGYKAAILKTDEYIGEILSALRGRPNYADENWLVIITSNKGSNVATDPAGAIRNAYQDSRRNTFFFAFNPRFNSLNPTRPGTIIPYIGTSPLYDGNNAASKAEALDGGTTYDFGAEGSYTISCKVKFKTGNYSYPAFLGKRDGFGGGKPGWVFFLEGNLWQINIGQVGQGNVQVKGQTVSDDKWHTLTAVIRQEGAKRMVYTYTDGVYSGNSADIAGKGNINSPAPLTVGFIKDSRGSNPVGYFVTDLRIYNEALTAEYIASNFCKINITPDDQYRNNLLGFWPATSVSGTKKLTDFSGKGHDLTVDQLNSVSFTELSTQICPDISEEVYRTVPNSVDIANLVYLWYGIIVPDSWGLDGKIWVPTYSDISGG